MRYELSDGGRTVTRTEETLADLTYQMRTAARLSGDPLFYEKAMLGDWFVQRFAKSSS